MNERLIIIGAGGQGKVAADIALKLEQYKEILFLDDDASITECDGLPVIGTIKDFLLYKQNSDFFVGVGNSKIRKLITEQLENAGVAIATLIHPSSVIGRQVEIGTGTLVMAGTVINPCAIIGKSCIITTCASVDHDCVIEDYVLVGVGAHVCGTVHIGQHTWIGAGATVIQGLNICSECMIGAGAVVIKDIENSGTYVGVPVRNEK